MSAPGRISARFWRDCLAATAAALCLSIAAGETASLQPDPNTPETPGTPSVKPVPPAAPAQPAPRLWDGRESIERYARCVDLPPQKVLKLEGGLSLEMVLIPAGQFVMGTPSPEKPDVWVLPAQLTLGVAVAFAIFMLVAAEFHSVCKRRRMQFSLRWLLGFVLVLGVAMHGGASWWRSASALNEWEAARLRFEAANGGEVPAHPVTLTRPFYMSKYEITQEQYKQVMGGLPCRLYGLDYPVNRVLWEEAREFCQRVGDYTHETVRLPTEAEWEFAARAGTKTLYYTGDSEEDLARAAWHYSDKIKGCGMGPVGKKEPNAFGLHDMLGNVWEWCDDCLGEYTAVPVTDPVGSHEGGSGTLRGGSWTANPGFCRSAYRSFPDDGRRRSDVGFRIVVVPAPREPAP